MSIQTDVLATAASRIGYYAPDDPEPGSEAGRYLAEKMGQPWMAGPSTDIWWCMAFVSMCLDLHGQADAIGGLSFNTDTTIAKVEAHPTAHFVDVEDAEPGDIVIFNWDGGGTDHVGFVEANLGGGWLQTIEGNTSSGDSGSQSAGNGVWRRQRSWGIACVIRPAYTEQQTAPDGAKLLAVDGDWGPATGARFREVFGLPASARWEDACRALQTFLSWTLDAYQIHAATSGAAWSIEVDGSDGPITWRCFQWWWNHCAVPEGQRIDVDGIDGPDTYGAVQIALNHSVRGMRALACRG